MTHEQKLLAALRRIAKHGGQAESCESSRTVARQALADYEAAAGAGQSPKLPAFAAAIEKARGHQAPPEHPVSFDGAVVLDPVMRMNWTDRGYSVSITDAGKALPFGVHLLYTHPQPSPPFDEAACRAQFEDYWYFAGLWHGDSKETALAKWLAARRPRSER